VLSDIPAGLTTDERGTARTTTYGSTTCVDSGAVQEHYALAFVTEPPASVGVNAGFTVAVQLVESGNPFKVAGIGIPVSLSSSNGGSLSGGTASTDSNGVATYSQIKVSAAGTGDTLAATVPVTAAPPPASQTKVLSASAGSSSFTVVAPRLPAVPTFSPNGGTYSSTQSVALEDITANASIYYTVDGSIPGPGSMFYTAPIPVTSTETINALAILNGVASGVSSATYTITRAPVCQTLNYSNGFTSLGLSLNGGAKINNNALELTDEGGFEARSAFYTTPAPVTSFTTDFTFQLVNPLADGITFTIQSNTAQALGGYGVGLGYSGIGKSVALKFDLFDNNGEGFDSIGIYLNGAPPTTPALSLAPAGLNLHSGHVFDVHIAYANAMATASLTDTSTHASWSGSSTGDITEVVGQNAYVGFTGGTGALSATQKILTWSFNGCSQ
jgi:hypothetical protein